MIKEFIMILNETGIHARPATKLVNEANRFKSDIFIEKGEKKANVKSILGVLGLAMAKNDQVYLLIEGEDEIEAFDTIKNLIDTKFGE